LLVLISISLYVEADVRIDLSKQTGYFEGDIDLSKQGRNGILATQKWTNGIIPYEMFGKNWSQEEKDMLQAAIKEIQSQSCVRFKPRTNEANYISVHKGGGCSSAVGMQGGPQYVSLQADGCWYHGTVVHELLHATGLWHEQSRYDRDDYIIINLENVINSTQYNFDMKFPNETSTYGVPYSFDSVMHYAKDAFSKNGEITLETIDPNMQEQIGNRERGVNADYEKVRRIYQCPGTYPAMPALPVKPLPTCADIITYCAQDKDVCQKEWANTHCRRYCGYCRDGCKDTINYCRQYKNDCNKLDWLKTHCPKSCKFCAPY